MGASARRQRARPADGAAVAVDENAIQVGTEWYWLYTAIDLDSNLLLGVRLSQRRGTTPAAVFLADLKQHHDLSDAYFLVDGYGYLTALARTDLRSDLEYVHRNKIEKWFHTLKMRVKRFHNTWTGSAASAQRWLAAFVYYYNQQRPNQALNGCTPAQVVLEQ